MFNKVQPLVSECTCTFISFKIQSKEHCPQSKFKHLRPKNQNKISISNLRRQTTKIQNDHTAFKQNQSTYSFNDYLLPPSHQLKHQNKKEKPTVAENRRHKRTKTSPNLFYQNRPEFLKRIEEGQIQVEDQLKSTNYKSNHRRTSSHIYEKEYEVKSSLKPYSKIRNFKDHVLHNQPSRIEPSLNQNVKCEPFRKKNRAFNDFSIKNGTSSGEKSTDDKMSIVEMINSRVFFSQQLYPNMVSNRIK